MNDVPIYYYVGSCGEYEEKEHAGAGVEEEGEKDEKEGEQERSSAVSALVVVAECW